MHDVAIAISYSYHSYIVYIYIHKIKYITFLINALLYYASGLSTGDYTTLCICMHVYIIMITVQTSILSIMHKLMLIINMIISS